MGHLAWFTRTGWGRLTLVGAFTLAAGCGPVGCGPAPAPPAPRTLVFTCQSQPQLWQVPSDVGVIGFDVFGAQGGAATDGPAINIAGGLGGEAKVIVPVTPGSLVLFSVGCAGNPGVADVGGGSSLGDGFGGAGGKWNRCLGRRWGWRDVGPVLGWDRSAGGGGGSSYSSVGGGGGGRHSRSRDRRWWRGLQPRRERGSTGNRRAAWRWRLSECCVLPCGGKARATLRILLRPLRPSSVTAVPASTAAEPRAVVAVAAAGTEAAAERAAMALPPLGVAARGCVRRAACRNSLESTLAVARWSSRSRACPLPRHPGGCTPPVRRGGTRWGLEGREIGAQPRVRVKRWLRHGDSPS